MYMYICTRIQGCGGTDPAGAKCSGHLAAAADRATALPA